MDVSTDGACAERVSGDVPQSITSRHLFACTGRIAHRSWRPLYVPSLARDLLSVQQKLFAIKRDCFYQSLASSQQPCCLQTTPRNPARLAAGTEEVANSRLVSYQSGAFLAFDAKKTSHPVVAEPTHRSVRQTHLLAVRRGPTVHPLRKSNARRADVKCRSERRAVLSAVLWLGSLGAMLHYAVPSTGF